MAKNKPDIHNRAKAQKRNPILLQITGVALVVLASVYYYLCGYQSSQNILVKCILFGGIGWVMILIFVMRNYISNRAAEPVENNLWRDELEYNKKLGNATWVLLVLIYGCLLYYVEGAREKRILDNEPSAITSATVKNVNITTKYNQTLKSADIEYMVNGMPIEKSVDVDLKRVSVGDKILIKYSIEYPEIMMLRWPN